jgi:putative hemolysin
MNGHRKKLFIWGILLIIVFSIFVLRFIIGGNEDNWICVNNQWVKHGNPTSPRPKTGCGKTTIANPASVYCEEQGGKLQIKKNLDGSEYGWCVLTDGRQCDEWNFFRTKVCK